MVCLTTSFAATTYGVVDKKKLHVHVSDDKTIFWPIDLPFWIRVATDPEDSENSFLMQQFHHSLNDKADKLKRNGVKLEKSGSQFIRWYNHLTKSEIRYKFVADGEPPTIDLDFLFARKYTNDKHVFYGPGLAMKIIPTDEHSGVETTFYRINEKKYSSYNKQLDFLQEKKYLVHYFSRDKVGYESTPQSTSFTVDTTPPETGHSLSGKHKNNILAPSAVIKLHSQDRLSGVKQIYYRYHNQRQFFQYSKSNGISTKDLASGDKVLFYYAVDQVGNRETPKQYKFTFDAQGPEIAHNFIGPSSRQNQKIYVSQSTRVQLWANDSRTGANQITHRINKEKTKNYKGPFSVQKYKGPITMHYAAIDHLNNKSPDKSIDLVVDHDPPKTRLTLSGETYSQASGVHFINSKTKINLSADDSGAGTAKIRYEYGQSGALEYVQPVSIASAGHVLFRYWAQDKVANLEAMQSLLLIVDNKAPEIIHDFSEAPLAKDGKVRTIKTKSGQEVQSYSNYTTLAINAIDDSSGVKTFAVTHNKKPIDVKNGTIQLRQPGLHEVRIEATDQVGNKSQEVILANIVHVDLRSR